MKLAKGLTVVSLAATVLVCGCAGTQTARVPAEPMVEYFKLDGGKLKPGKVKANAYYEIEKNGRIYVFISPKAKGSLKDQVRQEITLLQV